MGRVSAPWRSWTCRFHTPAGFCYAYANVSVLSSSGTTCTPKAFPWTHATAMKAAMDGCLHHDIIAGEHVVWPTNFGRMMTPWLVFATFINRGTVCRLYGSPISREFCRIMERSRTAMLGMIPSITDQLPHLNLLDDVSWDNVTRYSSTGESSSQVDKFCLKSPRNVFAAVIEFCPGIEMGGYYLSASVTSPQAPSMVQYGQPIDRAVRRSHTILNQDHYKVNFEGMPAMPNSQPMRRHGDRIRRQSGYYRAIGRAGPHDELGRHQSIRRPARERRIIDRNVDLRRSPPEARTDQLVVFVEVKIGARLSFHKLTKENLNPLFKVHDVRVIEKMPMTATGRILGLERRSLYKSQSKL